MTFRLISLFALSAFLSLQAVAQCTDPFSLTFSPAVICEGRSLQLDATSYPGATYTWTGPAGSGVGGPGPSSQTITSTSIGLHSGTYTVEMDYNGCKYTASVNIYIETTPKINGVVYTSPICPGEDNFFTANSASPIGSIYQWTGPGGWNFSSSLTNIATFINMQPINAGTYTLIVENSAGCKSDPKDFLVIVHPKVTADFSPTIMLGCEDDSVAFANLSTGHNTSQWLFGDGGISTLTNPIHTYKNQGSYTVKLVAGNGFCYDTVQQQVNFNHFVNADFTVDDDSICQNSTINFTNGTTFFPAILPTYDWHFKDGGTDNVTDPSHLYPRVGEYDAMLVATDYLGCKDTSYRHIVVDSAGSISFTSSETELCAGAAITFNGTFMPIGNIGIVWDMADGNTIKGRPDLLYSFDGSGIYNVKFIASYRICPDVEFSKNIVIKPYPKINLGPDATICPNGKPLFIKDLINEGNPNAKWAWNTAEKDETPGIQVRHAGSYAATVEIDGCTSTDTVVVSNNCYINIPNAFSPNGDGREDYFLPRPLLSGGITDFKMTIFNRWGQVIFATASTDGRGWDGTFNNEPQPLGVYVYLIEAGFENGAKEHYQGNVTLLR